MAGEAALWISMRRRRCREDRCGWLALSRSRLSSGSSRSALGSARRGVEMYDVMVEKRRGLASARRPFMRASSQRASGMRQA